MFDTIANSLTTLALLAGIAAALAFITGVIIFWRSMPDGVGTTEEDWFDKLPARARHRA